jgi:phospholipid/cholesterol/gamma-HCH transport system ATP-binding protein
VGTVAEVRESQDPRVQDLLNRRFEEEQIDPDAYLARLTGAGARRA